MSTRGCVAIKRDDGWVGVYNHRDSGPVYLGKKVWSYVQGKNLKQFAEDLLMFNTWDDYILQMEACSHCDKKHGPRCIECKFRERDSDGLEHIASDDPDPLSIEWVYVVDPERRTIDILTSQKSKRTTCAIRGYPILRDDGYWDYGHCAYRHARLASVHIDGEEPDWQFFEDMVCATPAVVDFDRVSEKDVKEIASALKGESRLVPTACIVCKRAVLAEFETAAHRRCWLRAIKDMGGDVNAWRGYL